ISMHHSISDGWSIPIEIKRVHEIYKRLSLNEDINIIEETAYLDAQDYFYNNRKEIKKYWDEKVKQIEAVNDINNILGVTYDLDNIKSIKNNIEKTLIIESDLYYSLKELIHDNGLTINVLFQFAWHKLIQTYTQDEKTIVGTTISGRDIPVDGIIESVGLYINTLPLIIDWNEKTVIEQLRNIHSEITELNNNSYINLAGIQKEGKRLFHTLLVFENYPLPNKDSKDDLNINFRESIEKLDYPLCISANEIDNKLIIKLNFSLDYLKEEKAKTILNQLQIILKQLPSKIDKSCNSITLVSEKEYELLVNNWNNNKSYYPDKTIHELFLEQTAKTPDNIALVFEDKEITYKVLNEKSNQLCYMIQKAYKESTGEEIKRDTLIGIYMDRSPEFIIAILGILKSGAAYVPYDTKEPKDRFDYKSKDSGIKFTLTSLDLIQLNNMPKENPPCINKPCDLAYIIYTSGSTGFPKGVMIEHSSVSNLVTAQKTNYGKNVLHIMPFIFDVSVEVLFTSICNGLTLHLIKDEFRTDISHIVSYINNHNIDTLIISASLIPLLPELSTVKILITGGEVCDKSVMDLWSLKTKFINSYGPTEATVCSTISYHSIDKSNINIGKPIKNKTVYILDSKLNPVPIGVKGELYIGGAGIARGYLNNQKLTEERFIDNPFASYEDKIKKENVCIYKTGDIARWLPDGDIEFLGRNDYQVKIRGFRVELGEIESRMLEYPEISKCAVLVKNRSGNKYLVGYYVSENEISYEKISGYLSSKLPDYMIPNIFIHLKDIPLSISGKIDRSSLPEPYIKTDEDNNPPMTDLEQKLCKIWEDILGVKQIRIKDNFFRLGGNSIIAIQVISRIKNATNISLKVSELFANPTIEKLSQAIIKSDEYDYLIPMNEFKKDIPNLFMIHPATGGCEVYHDLAKVFQNKFNCYGVDNYNLYHDIKINSLNLLARHYLNLIKKINKIDSYHLLGWSYGGQIALEMAVILEEEGITDINIVLLDTFLPDDRIIDNRTRNYDEDTEDIKQIFIKEGFNDEYIKKLIDTRKAENVISNQFLSRKLNSSKIRLFKAMKKENSSNIEEEYLINLSANNIDAFCKNIEVVKIDCNHANILQKYREMLYKLA
ncbi:MAG: amino acid adenylation domain-containing protein, partial [Desulfobacterales bacterium]|nr:amino acid adenylation domain-containing protein [Desulfobacterales bacterium]